MLKLTQLIGFGAGGAGRANAVDYNGSSDYLSRASALAGVSDSPYGTLSAWFRLDGGDGSIMPLFYSSNATLSQYGSLNISRINTNTIRAQIGIPSGGTSTNFEHTGVATYTAGASWRHLVMSFDVNHSAGNRLLKVYIDDSDTTNITTDEANPGASIGYTNHDYLRVANNVTQYFNGAIAELCWIPGLYLDLTSSANRRLFIDADGNPANVGNLAAAVQAATGTTPALYLPGDAATANVNAGTGGNMTINGSPATASSSPSD